MFALAHALRARIVASPAFTSEHVLGAILFLDTLDSELTVRENLIIYGRYFGFSRKQVRQRADELLEFVQLSERANDRVEPLSGGMKRRLTIARSLVNDPELMLLDEPTTGLDPQARHAVWDRLFRLKRQGVSRGAHCPLGVGQRPRFLAGDPEAHVARKKLTDEADIREAGLTVLAVALAT